MTSSLTSELKFEADGSVVVPTMPMWFLVYLYITCAWPGVAISDAEAVGAVEPMRQLDMNAKRPICWGHSLPSSRVVLDERAAEERDGDPATVVIMFGLEVDRDICPSLVASCPGFSPWRTRTKRASLRVYAILKHEY